MESKTVYFEKPGRENTDAVLDIAKQRAGELDIKTIVVATTDGSTAIKAMEILSGLKVITVTHVTGFRGPNIQECTAETRKLLESKGGVVLTAAHSFGGISRAMRNKFNTYVTGDIINNTLYIFGQGMKVVCEIALMAADSGSVRTDEEIISIAGTGRGADTAVVLTPVNTRDFFDLRVKEILCKPRL